MVMADADPPPPLSPDECREPTLQDLVETQPGRSILSPLASP